MTSNNKSGRSSRKRSHHHHHQQQQHSTPTTSRSSSAAAPGNGNSNSKSSHNKRRNQHKQQHPSSTSWKSLKRTLSLSSSTLNAITILIFAIMVGMGWNAWDNNGYFAMRSGSSSSNIDDPNIRSFLNRVCNNNHGRDNNNNNKGEEEDEVEVVYCHPSLIPRRRTQMAIRNIPSGTKVLEIPRSLQIWDLDALRDEWIRRNFVGVGGGGAPKHRRTNNPVDSAAYLALYLTLLVARDNSEQQQQQQQQQKQQQGNNVNNQNQQSTPPTTKERTILLDYLKNCMPSLNDLESFHPILWNDTELMERIQPHTATFSVTKAYRDMIKSEYQAFVDAISKNKKNNNKNKGKRIRNTNNDDYEKNDKKEDDDMALFPSEEYYTMFRILVLSRSFGTGPIHLHQHQGQPQEEGEEEDSYSQSLLSLDEMKFYRDEFGIDLSRGCYAMVPILDFYDSHPRPNVQYAFDIKNTNHHHGHGHGRRQNQQKASFVIHATGGSGGGILPGQEIVDNYGKYTDSHLFAKFGFVNGDGSGYSQANLATHHRVMDMDLKQQFSYLPFFRTPQPLDETLRKALDKQKEAVKQYLRFDDGYEECISMKRMEEDEGQNRHHYDYLQQAKQLKKLKWQHLSRIANHAQRWHLVLLPRAPESLPARASNIPITYDPPKMTKRNTKFFHRKEYHRIAATCRLISLTHEDYNGGAIQLLQDNLHNNSFLLESQYDNESYYSEQEQELQRDSLAAALEFRTHFCLARLASEAFQRFRIPLADMEDRVAKLNRVAFQSKEWTAAHLQLAEMQSLETLRGVSFSAAREYEDLRNRYPAFTIRDAPCPDHEWDTTT